jgi:hypothetical protein
MSGGLDDDPASERAGRLQPPGPHWFAHGDLDGRPAVIKSAALRPLVHQSTCGNVRRATLGPEQRRGDPAIEA